MRHTYSWTNYNSTRFCLDNAIVYGYQRLVISFFFFVSTKSRLLREEYSVCGVRRRNDMPVVRFPCRYLGGSSRGSATGENINPLKYREISVRTRRPIAEPRLGPKANPLSLSLPLTIQSDPLSLSLCPPMPRSCRRGGIRAYTRAGGIFSRNNNLSLSNNANVQKERRAGVERLCEYANKCWRNKILLPNNIRAGVCCY